MEWGTDGMEWNRLPYGLSALPTMWRADSKCQNPRNLFHLAQLRVLGPYLNESGGQASIYPGDYCRN